MPCVAPLRGSPNSTKSRHDMGGGVVSRHYSEQSEISTRGLLRLWFLGVPFALLLKVCSCWPPWLRLCHHHQQCSNIVFYLRDNLHWLDYVRQSLRTLLTPRCLFSRRLKWFHLVDCELSALSLITSMSYNVDYLTANSEFELFLTLTPSNSIRTS